MSKIIATIFDIQRNSFVDGPGIRTTVFFKGCNLRCEWCHNPESHSFEKQIMYYENQCTHCGKCKDLTCEDKDFSCPNHAKKICGKKYSVDEVLDVILKDKLFYKNSNGGVTFSGGECMLQIEFLYEILKRCKKNGIHTAVDTAGHVPWESFEKILEVTDLFLYDIKTMDSELHKKYTGVDNDIILKNLVSLLKRNIPVWIRIPVIKNINDSEMEFRRIKDFFKENGYPEKIEILPYHMMSEKKYTALGKVMKNFSVPDKEQLKRCDSIVNLL